MKRGCSGTLFFNLCIDFCLNIIYNLFKQKERSIKPLSHKIGRPTNDPKEHYTGIRLSDNELLKLEFCMEETGMTKTDVIRAGIDLVYEKITKEK